MKVSRISVVQIALGLTMLLCVAVSPLQAQSVEQLYKAKCAMCHGATGKGDTAAGKSMGAHDFASPEVQKESEAEVTTIIAKGKNKMPAYGSKLKESEIKELAAYVKELGKK
jgi:mono/diheme cytochrome c family protein